MASERRGSCRWRIRPDSRRANLAATPSSQHDVAADGPQFLLIKDSSENRTAGSNLTIVLNWFDELKRVATVK